MFDGGSSTILVYRYCPICPPINAGCHHNAVSPRCDCVWCGGHIECLHMPSLPYVAYPFLAMLFNQMSIRRRSVWYKTKQWKKNTHVLVYIYIVAPIWLLYKINVALCLSAPIISMCFTCDCVCMRLEIADKMDVDGMYILYIYLYIQYMWLGMMAFEWMGICVQLRDSQEEGSAPC